MGKQCVKEHHMISWIKSFGIINLSGKKAKLFILNLDNYHLSSLSMSVQHQQVLHTSKQPVKQTCCTEFNTGFTVFERSPVNVRLCQNAFRKVCVCVTVYCVTIALMECLETANPKQWWKQMHLEPLPSIFASSILSASSMHHPKLWLRQLAPH